MWRRWLRLSKTPDERIEELEELIQVEFDVIIGGLVRGCDERLDNLKSELNKSLSLFSILVVEALERRSRKTIVRLQEMSEEAESQATDSEQQFRRQRLDELETTLPALQSLAEDLAAFCQVWPGRADNAQPA